MQNYACGYVDEPHLPQSGTAENVYAAGAGRESRKRSGQNRERLAVLRVAGTGGDRRNTPGLCGAYDACRGTPQENPTRKLHKKNRQEKPIRKTDKKNRQEKSEKRTDLGVLPGAKIRF